MKIKYHVLLREMICLAMIVTIVFFCASGASGNNALYERFLLIFLTSLCVYVVLFILRLFTQIFPPHALEKKETIARKETLFFSFDTRELRITSLLYLVISFNSWKELITNLPEWDGFAFIFSTGISFAIAIIVYTALIGIRMKFNIFPPKLRRPTSEEVKK